jgi:hypothetical protein
VPEVDNYGLVSLTRLLGPLKAVESLPCYLAELGEAKLLVDLNRRTSVDLDGRTEVEECGQAPALGIAINQQR